MILFWYTLWHFHVCDLWRIFFLFCLHGTWIHFPLSFLARLIVWKLIWSESMGMVYMVSQKWYNVQAHKSNIFVNTIDLQPTLLYKSDISRLVSANWHFLKLCVVHCLPAKSNVWCITGLQWWWQRHLRQTIFVLCFHRHFFIFVIRFAPQSFHNLWYVS